MAEPVHSLYWRRATQALRERGALIDGSPSEIAAHAERTLGTDAVRRFVNEYYLERQYGGGSGRISDSDAESLIAMLESLPRASAAAAAVPLAMAASEPTSATEQTPSGRHFVRIDLEEAEAYGAEDAGSADSPLAAVKRFFADLGAERAARAERARRQKEERRRQREARRKKSEIEQKLRTEERAEAVRQAEAEEAQRQKEMRDRTEAEINELITRIKTLSDAGDRSGTVNIMEQVAIMAPEDASTWFTLGWYFGKAGNFSRSTACYRQGLEIDPSNKVAWNNLGHDLRRRRRHKEAVVSLRKALELDSDYITAWANLGTTLREKSDFSGAADAFSQAVRLAPNEGAAWYWLGVCKMQRIEYAAAAEALRRATEISPNNWDGWTRLGQCLERLGRRDEARAAFSKASELGPKLDRLGAEIWPLGLLAIGASYAASRLEVPWAGIIPIACFLALTWRLKPTRVQLFMIAVVALPLLALHFIDEPDAGPIAMVALVLWAFFAVRFWRRIGRGGT